MLNEYNVAYDIKYNCSWCRALHVYHLILLMIYYNDVDKYFRSRETADKAVI